MKNELTWMIGGPQGSGVETAANIFSQVYSKMGYHVFGKREYYSCLLYTSDAADE